MPPPEAGSAITNGSGRRSRPTRLSGCGSGCGRRQWLGRCVRGFPPVLLSCARNPWLPRHLQGAAVPGLPPAIAGPDQAGCVPVPRRPRAWRARGSARRAEPAVCSNSPRPVQVGPCARPIGPAVRGRGRCGHIFVKRQWLVLAHPSALGRRRRPALARCHLVFSLQGGTAPGSGLLHRTGLVPSAAPTAMRPHCRSDAPGPASCPGQFLYAVSILKFVPGARATQCHRVAGAPLLLQSPRHLRFCRFPETLRSPGCRPCCQRAGQGRGLWAGDRHSCAWAASRWGGVAGWRHRQTPLQRLVQERCALASVATAAIEPGATGGVHSARQCRGGRLPGPIP